MSRVLYHYTNKLALASILEEKLLRPSLRRRRPGDVRHGEGQYFTDVAPGTLDAQELSLLLVGHPDEDYRFTHFAAIDVSKLSVTLGREGIFVILGKKNLDLTGRIVHAGRNENDLSQNRMDSQPS